MSFKQIIKLIISLPKTIIFNFKVLPFRQAIKLPILITYNVKVANLIRNSVMINSDLAMFMIKINWTNGSPGAYHSHKKTGYLNIKRHGKIIFNGRADFSSGISIRVDKGELNIGDSFSCNRQCFLSCSSGILIEDDVLLGWGVNIRDSDGHEIYNLNNPDLITNEPESVRIGTHTWLASNVDVLKGATIPSDCIVGYNSFVGKKFKESNCIIAGYPAKVVKRNIEWRA